LVVCPFTVTREDFGATFGLGFAVRVVVVRLEVDFALLVAKAVVKERVATRKTVQSGRIL
jgi:hypothetical protein